MPQVVANILCNFVHRMEYSFCKFVLHTSLPFCKRPCDEEKGHIGPSSSRWFVLYGLDRVGWLALILGLCKCVDELELK